jgi:hypothetical protein
MMSNAPYIPPPSPPTAPPPLDYEHIPSSGVRKVLDAFEERDLQRIRWGSVLAGLFLAIGAQVMLVLLGAAIGLTVVDEARVGDPLGKIATAAGAWMALSSLVALFLGGYAAAKLGGSIRRSDGVLSGMLTWAASLVLTLMLVGSGLSAALSGAIGVAQSPLLQRQDTLGTLQREAPAREDAIEAARRNKGDMAKGAWGAFGGAAISLLAAIAGGALGAVGTKQGDDDEPEKPGRKSRKPERVPTY